MSGEVSDTRGRTLERAVVRRGGNNVSDVRTRRNPAVAGKWTLGDDDDDRHERTRVPETVDVKDDVGRA